MFVESKGFKAQITKQFIGIMVVIIIGVAVVIPVVANVTASAGLTGTTKTLVDLLPLFSLPLFFLRRMVKRRDRNSVDPGSRWTLLGSQPCIPTNLGW